MPDDAVHAVHDERVRGADAELKCEARAEGVVAACAEEAAGEDEEGAGEEGGGECGEEGGVRRGECGGEEEFEEGVGEGGWTVSAQRKED